MFFEGIQEGMAYCQMIYDDHSNPIDWRYIKVNAQFTLLTELKDIEGKRSQGNPGIIERDRIFWSFTTAWRQPEYRRRSRLTSVP